MMDGHEVVDRSGDGIANFSPPPPPRIKTLALVAIEPAPVTVNIIFTVGVQAGINSFHADDHRKLLGTFHHPDSAGGGRGAAAPGLYDGDLIGGQRDDCGGNDGDDETNSTPEFFDARYHWFECPSISHIWDQGNCAADWVRYSPLINDCPDLMLSHIYSCFMMQGFQI